MSAVAPEQQAISLIDSGELQACGVDSGRRGGPGHRLRAGVDSIISTKLVGPSGVLTGIDLVPEMLAKASENARLAGVDNVTFQDSSIVSVQRVQFHALR